MKLTIKLLLGVALALLLGMSSEVMRAHADVLPACVYVPESGHNVHGAFLAFYVSHNGPENFGLPITEAFWEDGQLVQYFTRARLELHPENPEPYRVLLGLLGVTYGITDPPIKSSAIPSPNNPNFRYFPDTGLFFSFQVKDYFDSHGGVDVLGYPASLLRYENGLFVQYFQRARLEWSPADNIIRLSPVGQIILDKKYPADFKPRARMPNDWCTEFNLRDWPPRFPTPTIQRLSYMPTPMPAGMVMRLKVNVRFRQTGASGPQYVDISVDDQNGRALPSVALYAVVHFSNGDRYFPLLSTDANGRSSFNFDIGAQPANSTTVVEVRAMLGSLTANGSDVFNR